ncbi:hypothetical protein K438DRAFT_1583566 [Mycena galopus ATCC 62051]|nr:hypothetical protein K438DRAFT_1583566 [Mycena galopus ATCC 62051]
MSAQDFLRAFHRDVKVSTSNADKAKAFKNYLAANSDADDWFQALPAATKLNMDLIDIAIEAQYPAEPTVQPTAAEFGTELLRCKLTKEELGTKVKVADHEVWAHHAWGTKMLRLAMKAGVSATTTYIEQVQVELPGPLRTKIGKTHADWPAFIKAVRDVDTVELELDMKEEKERREEFSKMRQALQTSPTAGIRAQLTNVRLGPPAQAAARWPTPAPGANPFQSTGGGQGNLFAAPQTPQQQQAPRAPAIARMVHHPDTDAGRHAHADQQQEWYCTHGNIEVTVNTPYPLRSGRAPVDSGECFRCGIMGHTNYMRRCEAPQEQCVSAREQQWRRIAAQALKDTTAAVWMVGYSPWDVDDYGRPFGDDAARFEEVENQGKA